MNKEKLIQYLRISLNLSSPPSSIPTEDDGFEDVVYMSDEELELFISTAINRNFPRFTIDTLPEKDFYPVMLLCKRELYSSLAIRYAPRYDMGADNNNYLKRSQQFKHFMALAEQAKKDYEDYLENGAGNGNTVYSRDLMLSVRNNTLYNYERGTKPTPFLYVDGVTNNSIKISWILDMRCTVSIFVLEGEEEIFDLYNVFKRNTKAKKVSDVYDPHILRYEIPDLKPNTTYTIGMMVSNEQHIRNVIQATATTES